MKPVNLLPVSERRNLPAKRLENSSVVVLGILAVLLLGGLYYVSTNNKINGARSDIATDQQRTAVAKARTAQLGSFARFAKIKQTREDSVRQLATQRFDWERLMREVALVLPAGTQVTSLDASSSGQAAGASGGTPSASPSTSSPSTSSGSSGAASGQPSLQIAGCATSQPEVATMMVRLRAMDRVDDVSLQSSAKNGTGGASGSSSAPQSDGAGQAGDCRKNYTFAVTVTFKPADTDTGTGSGKGTPTRLGGGA